MKGCRCIGHMSVESRSDHRWSGADLDADLIHSSHSHDEAGLRIDQLTPFISFSPAS